MELVNDFTVSVPVEEAWPTLTDVERIAPCLPGAQLQEIEGDVYRGVVKVKVGPILAQFKGQATFIEKDHENHKAVLKAEGRDTAGKGNASALITAQLEPLGDAATKVTVTTDLTITGKVAQFGRGALADVEHEAAQAVRRRPARDGAPPRQRATALRRAPPVTVPPAGRRANAGNGEAPAEAGSLAGPTAHRARGTEPVDLVDVAGVPGAEAARPHRHHRAARARHRAAPQAPRRLSRWPGPLLRRRRRLTTAAVARLLGREPQGGFEVAVRDSAGEPLVIRNAPLLDDGTPMPTRYWLVGAAEAAAVSRLEAAGGVRARRGRRRPARRWPPPMTAMPTSETRHSLPGTPGRARRAASAAPAPG